VAAIALPRIGGALRERSRDAAHPHVLRRRHACGGAGLRRARGAAPHAGAIAAGRRRAPPSRSGPPDGTSGGSFTALAYALYGERLFGFYEEAFLKRNVQGELIDRLLDPLDWPRVLSQGVGRSELAAAYYDEILFKGRHLRGPRPPADALRTHRRHRRQHRRARRLSRNSSSTRCASTSAGCRSPAPRRPRPRCRACCRPSLCRTAAARAASSRRRGWWRRPAPARAAARQPCEQRLQRMEVLGDAQAPALIHLVDGGLSDNLGLVSVVQVLQEMMDSATFRPPCAATACGASPS